MLHQLLGQEVAFEGRNSVKRGTSGCVLHGPYEVLDPGRYFVIFNIATDGQNNHDQDRVYATIDVVLDRTRYVSKDIRGSRLAPGPVTEALSFVVEKRTTAEYRVFASGVTSLMIDTTRRVVQIPTDAGDLTPFIEANLFPTAAQAPEFFRSNMPKLRALYDRGARIKFIDSNVVIQLDGVSLHAQSMDDIWFIDEIFFKLTYNVISDRPCCVIDVGMKHRINDAIFGE
jgi:hypothetical protein